MGHVCLSWASRGARAGTPPCWAPVSASSTFLSFVALTDNQKVSLLGAEGQKTGGEDRGATTGRRVEDSSGPRVLIPPSGQTSMAVLTFQMLRPEQSSTFQVSVRVKLYLITVTDNQQKGKRC